jgi:DNA-binding GntR family transcriptional regulator
VTEEAVKRREMSGRIGVIRRKLLRDLVYESLRKAILGGRVKAGEYLTESELASQIGISRTPVREALRKLELDGFVTRFLKRGFGVIETSGNESAEILNIRIALEGYAAYLAINDITPEKMHVLERKMAESNDAWMKGNKRRALQLRSQFYERLYEFCENKRLIKLIKYYQRCSNRYPFVLACKKNHHATMEDDRRVMDAILEKNGKLVERLVRKCISKGQGHPG